VHEHVLGAIFRLNEAEAFLSIEELNGANRHLVSFHAFVGRPHVHRVSGNNQSFGRSLAAQPKTAGACQRAENQVAGGQIDAFAFNVNNSARNAS
jgi:hypothetical protein